MKGVPRVYVTVAVAQCMGSSELLSGTFLAIDLHRILHPQVDNKGIQNKIKKLPNHSEL